MKIKNYLIMLTMFAGISVFSLTSCESDSGNDGNSEADTETLTEEQKNEVIEIENLTEEVENEAQSIKEEAEDMVTEVDSLLEDI